MPRPATERTLANQLASRRSENERRWPQSVGQGETAPRSKRAFSAHPTVGWGCGSSQKGPGDGGFAIGGSPTQAGQGTCPLLGWVHPLRLAPLLSGFTTSILTGLHTTERPSSGTRREKGAGYRADPHIRSSPLPGLASEPLRASFGSGGGGRRTLFGGRTGLTGRRG